MANKAKVVNVAFSIDEAEQYLIDWLESHSAWVPEEIGNDDDRNSVEEAAPYYSSWEQRWMMQSFFEHPVIPGLHPGKRFCFHFSDTAYFAKNAELPISALGLRAWVTCFQDDVVTVELGYQKPGPEAIQANNV